MKQTPSSIYEAITTQLGKTDILGMDFDPLAMIGEKPELLKAKGIDAEVRWPPGPMTV